VIAALAGALLADDNDVTQGPGGTGTFLGFLFTFLLAGVLIVLALSLTRQLRKVDRNARAAGLLPESVTSESSGVPTPEVSDVAEGGGATSEESDVRGSLSSDVAGEAEKGAGEDDEGDGASGRGGAGEELEE
jgi:hypothetical protein